MSNGDLLTLYACVLSLWHLRATTFLDLATPFPHFASTSVYWAMTSSQGWEFTLSLFAVLLKIAPFKERLWVIHSCRSLKKSNREWITLIILFKRATGSKLFSIRIRIFLIFFIPLFMPKSESLPSFFTKERPWAICYTLGRFCSWVSFVLIAVCTLERFFNLWSWRMPQIVL